MPRASAPPAQPVTAPGRATAAALVANHSHHDPVRVVEEAVLDGLPTAQPEVLRVDREQALRLLEPERAAFRDRLQHRPVPRVRVQLLRLRGPEELREGP